MIAIALALSGFAMADSPETAGAAAALATFSPNAADYPPPPTKVDVAGLPARPPLTRKALTKGKPAPTSTMKFGYSGYGEHLWEGNCDAKAIAQALVVEPPAAELADGNLRVGNQLFRFQHFQALQSIRDNSRDWSCIRTLGTYTKTVGDVSNASTLVLPYYLFLGGGSLFLTLLGVGEWAVGDPNDGTAITMVGAGAFAGTILWGESWRPRFPAATAWGPAFRAELESDASLALASLAGAAELCSSSDISTIDQAEIARRTDACTTIEKTLSEGVGTRPFLTSELLTLMGVDVAAGDVWAKATRAVLTVRKVEMETFAKVLNDSTAAATRCQRGPDSADPDDVAQCHAAIDGSTRYPALQARTAPLQQAYTQGQIAVCLRGSSSAFTRTRACESVLRAGEDYFTADTASRVRAQIAALAPIVARERLADEREAAEQAARDQAATAQRDQEALVRQAATAALQRFAVGRWGCRTYPTVLELLSDGSATVQTNWYGTDIVSIGNWSLESGRISATFDSGVFENLGLDSMNLRLSDDLRSFEGGFDPWPTRCRFVKMR